MAFLIFFILFRPRRPSWPIAASRRGTPEENARLRSCPFGWLV